jgi:hypothetical protein
MTADMVGKIVHVQVILFQKAWHLDWDTKPERMVKVWSNIFVIIIMIGWCD